MSDSFSGVKKYLAEYSRRSDLFLSSFFNKKEKEGIKIDPEIKKTLNIFERYASGGKKLRGALTVLGYQMVAGANFKAILSVSCGVELLHNFLLIHDDIIDKDALRRGKPTVHEQIGISKAIVVGDMGAFLGHDLIVSSGFPKEDIVSAVSTLNNLMLKTIYGEMLDIDYDGRKNLSWEDIYRVRLYKTAYYTFVMPLLVGATLARANSKVKKAIEVYGINVGIAFQVADDILGVFGDIQITGKSVSSDIKDGKKTFLYAKAVELASPKEKTFLEGRYGAVGLKNADIDKIKKIFKDSGSLAYSKSLAVELVAKGKKEIAKMTKHSGHQNILGELADFVVNRDK